MKVNNFMLTCQKYNTTAEIWCFQRSIANKSMGVVYNGTIHGLQKTVVRIPSGLERSSFVVGCIRCPVLRNDRR